MYRLKASGIHKSFPGVKALDGVDFKLAPGEIHALMGENGAGKSTLIKILTGACTPDQGEILLNRSVISPRSPAQAQMLGISTVYQEVNLIPPLSIAENFYLGRQPRRYGLLDWKTMRKGASEAVASLGLQVDVTRPLGSFPLAIQQMVAIARALDCSAQILVLDEPTSSLDADEAKRLFEVMLRLKAKGVAILFVTHFLEQVYAVSDRITILRGGRLIGEYLASEISRLELVSLMLGQKLGQGIGKELPKKVPEPGGVPSPESHKPLPFLQVRGLSRKGALKPLDLEVGKGETVGLAGLLGSGRTETARLLFGVDRADQGEIRINDQAVDISNPRQASRHGFGFCPEDRKSQGIVPDLSIRENIILALQARIGWMRSLSRRRQEEISDRYIQALGISASSREQPIRTLSGGNQQKAILARWLAMDPRFLILDEPTRGIDVGAKAEIQNLIRALNQEGKSILFISSELEEVVQSSQRVVVLRDHGKVGEFTGEQVQEETIMRAIAGGSG